MRRFRTCTPLLLVLALCAPGLAQTNPLHYPINDHAVVDQGQQLQVMLNGNITLTPADLQVCTSLTDPTCSDAFRRGRGGLRGGRQHRSRRRPERLALQAGQLGTHRLVQVLRGPEREQLPFRARCRRSRTP